MSNNVERVEKEVSLASIYGTTFTTGVFLKDKIVSIFDKNNKELPIKECRSLQIFYNGFLIFDRGKHIKVEGRSEQPVELTSLYGRASTTGIFEGTELIALLDKNDKEVNPQDCGCIEVFYNNNMIFDYRKFR